ncbi:MAG: hypothetical protein IJU23_03170 [Proteobacteria bacterium]|nr:hypothetical protein [Pseudomonadota bacterium]
MADDINKDSVDETPCEIDWSLCCPDENAPAEPYHAIMFTDDDGKTNGNLWGQGTQLMLFDSVNAAKKILEALNSPNLKLRGVTKAHFGELKKLEASGHCQLFVIDGFSPNGQIEAMPLAEHQARVTKAGNPPPLKKKS